MASVYGTNGSDVIDEQDGVTNGGDAVYDRAGNDVMFGLGTTRPSRLTVNEFVSQHIERSH